MQVKCATTETERVPSRRHRFSQTWFYVSFSMAEKCKVFPRFRFFFISGSRRFACDRNIECILDGMTREPERCEFHFSLFWMSSSQNNWTQNYYSSLKNKNENSDSKWSGRASRLWFWPYFRHFGKLSVSELNARTHSMRAGGHGRCDDCRRRFH